MLVASHPHFVTTRLFPCPFLARHPSNTALPPVPYCLPIHLLLSGWAMLCLRTDFHVVKPARALLYPASSSQSPPCADFHHQASLDRMHRPWSAIPWFGVAPLQSLPTIIPPPSPHVLTSHDFSHISLVLVRSHRPRTRHIYLLTSLCRWPV